MEKPCGICWNPCGDPCGHFGANILSQVLLVSVEQCPAQVLLSGTLYRAMRRSQLIAVDAKIMDQKSMFSQHSRHQMARRLNSVRKGAQLRFGTSALMIG